MKLTKKAEKQTENRILREKLETYEKIKADMDKEELEE